FNLAAQHVINDADALFGNLHAYDVRLTRCQTALNLVFRQEQTTPVILGRLTPGLLLATHLVQFFGRSKTIKGMTFGNQLFSVLAVDTHPLALTIGAMRAADIRTFVPLQAKPAQTVEDGLLGLGGAAGLIRVFDTQ